MQHQPSKPFLSCEIKLHCNSQFTTCASSLLTGFPCVPLTTAYSFTGGYHPRLEDNIHALNGLVGHVRSVRHHISTIQNCSSLVYRHDYRRTRRSVVLEIYHRATIRPASTLALARACKGVFWYRSCRGHDLWTGRSGM